ncbi:DUF167 family protein YggU [soil metagenome]
MPVFTQLPSGCRIEVSVQPKAKRCAVVGLHGDTLKIALDAPPVDGKANEALRRFLAERLGVALSRVEIVRGEKSRRKAVVVSGITAAEAEKALMEH